ncbi:MAG: hypothetical protein IJ416_11205 [Ruminiclostridium sp.]|nr:hypothetical protein [Ruminiclostridium sp.]
MNKNDFYKELMTQYALDPEKIRMNALKQAKQPAWQRVVGDYWKPAMGAAAAVAVAFAGVSYANRSSAPDITVEPEQVLSASQRLIEAEQNYYNTTDEETFSNVYLTFLEPVSYNELLMALSTVADSGEIELCALYLQNETVWGDGLAEYAAASSENTAVIGAKISLPVSYYRDIQDLSIVYLAELGSAEINDDTFTPITVEDDDPLEGDLMGITTSVTEKAPVVTTTPFSFDVSETEKEPVPVIGDSGADSVTTLPPASESETEEEEDPIDVEAPEITTTVTTAVPVTTTPAETTTTYYRGDVGLLTEIYELNVQNSLETIISGNNVVVLAKNEAYFYTIGGFSGTPVGEVIGIVNPKLACENDSHIILTGCREDGARTLISVINLENDTVYTYDASANIGDCELGSFRYSEDLGKYFMKAVNADSTLIYELTVNNELSFRPLAEIEAPVTLAGYGNDILYFTFLDGDYTRLYNFNCVDGTISEISAFSGVVKIKRGSDFNSFALYSTADETSFILDVNTGMLVPAVFDETIAIITDGGETFFRTGGTVYKIDSLGMVIPADRTVTFEKTENEEFIVNEITSEKIVIIRNDGNIW